MMPALNRLRLLFIILIACLGANARGNLHLTKYDIDSTSLRAQMDTQLCVKNLVLPTDFYNNYSKCISSIIGTGNGSSGLSNVKTTLLYPSVSGSYGFLLTKRRTDYSSKSAEKVWAYMNVGTGINFSNLLTQIDITNPNIEFDINTEFSIFFRPQYSYYNEQCLNYTDNYENFMLNYIHHKQRFAALVNGQDSLKKAGACLNCIRDTDVYSSDTLFTTAVKYMAIYRNQASKERLKVKPPVNGLYKTTQADSASIYTNLYYCNNNHYYPISADTIRVVSGAVIRFNHSRLYSDSLAIKKEAALLKRLDTEHKALLALAPFNTKLFNWVSVKLNYKLQSFLVYNDQLPVTEYSTVRTQSSVYAISLNYNLYHYVNTQYRAGRGNFLAWGGNKYLRIGADLLWTNAVDDRKNGPYKVILADTLPNGSTYTRKTITVYSKNATDRLFDIIPHADFYIMENTKTVGLHLLSNYTFSCINNREFGNKLNCGAGIFFSLGQNFAKRLDQLKGIPLNFELSLTATDILNWGSKPKISDRLAPDFRVLIPLNLLGR